MFRLFRLVIFMSIAFVAGILYERSAIVEKCLTRGGEFSKGCWER